MTLAFDFHPKAGLSSSPSRLVRRSWRRRRPVPRRLLRGRPSPDHRGRCPLEAATGLLAQASVGRC